MITPLQATSQLQLKLKPKQLTLQDLQTAVPVPFRIEDGHMILEKSLRSWKFQQPVKVPLEQVLAVGDQHLLAYVIEGCAPMRPRLIPFVLENKTMLVMARYLLYSCSGSTKSLYNYAEGVSLYSRFLEASPDRIIHDVKAGTNLPDQIRIQNHVGLLQQYSEQLQSSGLSPSRVHGLVKEARTFYRRNGVKLELPEKLSRRVKYRDQVPTPEQLSRMMELADLRGRVIVSLAALGGFREETLTRLEYRHVREDVETGKIPLHVHLEAEMVKGKYGDHDTFLATEAVQHLRLYLEDRRKGSADGRRPPETLNDNSPLIRSDTSHVPRPISTKQIRKLVHDLYRRADLLKKVGGRMYNLREHSLRKYFKTQLISRGVPESHADYWMGHVTDTYNQVQSLGIEKQRQEYASSGLSIKPQTQISKLETIKEIIRAMGENPDKILTREALIEPATTTISPEEYGNHHTQILQQYLRQLLLQATQNTSVQTSRNGFKFGEGGAAERVRTSSRAV